MDSHGSDWWLAAGAWNNHDCLSCSGYVFRNGGVNSNGGCCRRESRRDRNCVSRPKITCSSESLSLGNVDRLLKQRAGWLRD